MDCAFIYLIVNGVNGKVYVGSTISPANRWKMHRLHLRRGTHHSRRLQHAWKKHGEAAFTFQVVTDCRLSERVFMEQHWMDTLRCCEHGYNMNPTAESCTGRKHSEETKRRISEAHRGRERSALHRQRIGDAQRGRKLSEEHRHKVSLALKGRTLTQETIQKLVAARKGKRLGEQARRNISEAARRRPPPSATTREKLAAASRGRKWTEAQREKMLARKLAGHTEATRQVLSMKRGGRPFVVIHDRTGVRHEFATLGQAKDALGLDPSNLSKCLRGKAKSTGGYRCHYKGPKSAGQV